MKVAIIACSSTKHPKHNVEAQNLYAGWTFESFKKLAQKEERWYIVSAKYGLLRPNDKISVYDFMINQMTKTERILWGKKVIISLASECDLANDTFILYCPESYHKHFASYLKNKETPVKGLGIGEQRQYLKNNL